MKKWNIGWGVVSSCNMNCEFCYSSERRNLSSDISFSYWKKFIDENAAYIATINYGTGENSISQEWFKLIRYIRVNYPQIRQSLTTNGYISVATERNEDNMRAFLTSIDEVDVSLDFADAVRHCAFRGQPKAYEWARNAMALCYRNNIPLTIVVLGSKQNLTEENIAGIFDVAKQYDAIVRVNMYRPTHGINEKSRKYILSIQDLLEFLRFVKDRYKVLSLNDPVISSLLTDSTVDDPSGMDSLRILPNGDVTPSTYLITDEFVIANLKNGVSLRTLEDSTALKNTIRKIIPKACHDCEHREKCCGGVLDRRYLWYGTLSERVLSICQKF